jgi:hypothetical protein
MLCVERSRCIHKGGYKVAKRMRQGARTIFSLIQPATVDDLPIEANRQKRPDILPARFDLNDYFRLAGAGTALVKSAKVKGRTRMVCSHEQRRSQGDNSFRCNRPQRLFLGLVQPRTFRKSRFRAVSLSPRDQMAMSSPAQGRTYRTVR